MIRIIFILIIHTIFLINFSFSQSTHIAVMELDAEGVSESETRIISERLRLALFKTGIFSVLERDKMQEILDEQGFQLSGCTTIECAVEAGKMIGVEKMVMGSIGQIGILYTLNARIIDIESGRVFSMEVDDCDCEIETVLVESTEKIAVALAKAISSQTNENIDSLKSEIRYKKGISRNYVSFMLGGVPSIGYSLGTRLGYQTADGYLARYAFLALTRDDVYAFETDQGYTFFYDSYSLSVGISVGIGYDGHNWGPVGLPFFGADYFYSDRFTIGIENKGFIVGAYYLTLDYNF